MGYAEGNHCPCSFSNEDQDHCPTREEVLCMDWRIHPGFTLHLPTDVDQQTGIRRIRPINCPQKVLLKSRALSFCATFVHSKLTKSNTLAGRNWQLINTLLDCAFSTVTSIPKIILIVFNKPAFVPSIYRRPIYL